MLTFSMVFIKNILPVTICLVNCKIFFCPPMLEVIMIFQEKLLFLPGKIADDKAVRQLRCSRYIFLFSALNLGIHWAFSIEVVRALNQPCSCKRCCGESPQKSNADV